MKPRRAAWLLLALAAFQPAGACHRARRATDGPGGAAAQREQAPAGTDSLEGIVRLVGVDALPLVTLVLDDGRTQVTLDGPASLRRLAGLRLAVAGERAGSRLAVTRFTVRSANGVSATDGIIAADGEAIALVTPDGVRHRLVNPPPLLRAGVGHRAWVSGPLDREPVAYGIID